MRLSLLVACGLYFSPSASSSSSSPFSPQPKVEASPPFPSSLRSVPRVWDTLAGEWKGTCALIRVKEEKKKGHISSC